MKSAYYIVTTATGYYGKGWSIHEAAKAAKCLNPKWKIRRNVGQTRVSKITGDIEHTLTEDDLNPMHNGGLTYQGFKPGDKHLPWVTQYGSIIHWGAFETLGTLTAEMLQLERVAAAFGDTRGGKDTTKANAKLIAAAPQLLEIVQELEQFIIESGINGASQITTKAREVLTKATAP